MIRLAEQRLRLMFDEPSEYHALIAKGLTFRHRPNSSEKLKLSESGYFSLELFEALICGGESYKTGPVNFIWQRLVAARIVLPAFGPMPGAFVDHAIDTPILLEHLRGDTFQNLFAPPAALADRYSHALLAIDVLTDGEPYRGSGFIAQAAHDRAPFIVTCRHNVDPAGGIEMQAITTAAGRVLIAIGTAGDDGDFGDGRNNASFRLLPAAQQLHAAAPTIASTPVPQIATAPAKGDAGIWSTPAEFAPPE
ncbi:MAG: hypothetical protein LC648_02825 [Novosphingobium sp.]|nr:hypothetical protein [Novosphingobium sp.]